MRPRATHKYINLLVIQLLVTLVSQLSELSMDHQTSRMVLASFSQARFSQAHV